MYDKEARGKCRIVKSISDKQTFYCLQPATVVLVDYIPEAGTFAVCLDCARELVKEIIDSVPNGRRDLRRHSC